MKTQEDPRPWTLVTYGGVVIATPAHREDATNALRYLVDAYPDEPLFVIRGRDKGAASALQRYAINCDAIAETQSMYPQVMMHRERFRAFAVNHPELMKWADPFPGWPEIQASPIA